MSKTRAWLLTAIFLTGAVALLLTLYLVRDDCAYTAELPECTKKEEVAAAFLGFGGYGLLLVGVIFLVRAIWMELRQPPVSAPAPR